MVVSRRSVTDPLFFSRSESFDDETIPVDIQDIDIDFNGPGVEFSNKEINQRNSKIKERILDPKTEKKKRGKVTSFCRRLQHLIFHRNKLLLEEEEYDQICLVLDLDETLVHSTFSKPVFTLLF